MRRFKSYLTVIFSILFCSLFFYSCNGSGNSKKISVGFCNVSKENQNAVLEVLNESFDFNIKSSQIEKSEILFNVKQLNKKYDLIFTNNGELSTILKEISRENSEDLNSIQPESVVNDNKTISVLIDHYGVAYSNPVRNNANLNFPLGFDQFEKYLNTVKDKVRYPLFVEGSDDTVFLAFLAAMVESFAGEDGYLSFIKALTAFDTMENFLNTIIANGIRIRDIFEVIKDWQSYGYLTKGWTKGTLSDFKFYSEEAQIAVAFISLSFFHNLKYTIAKDYACDRFPVKNTKINHGLIAPELIVMNLNKTEETSKIIEYILSPEGQKRLSEKSKLAPAVLNGMAFDKQADDVRFLAAACKAGPLAIPTDAIVTNSKNLEQAVTNIRSYFE